jgi:hypothetical protein
VVRLVVQVLQGLVVLQVHQQALDQVVQVVLRVRLELQQHLVQVVQLVLLEHLELQDYLEIDIKLLLQHLSL